MKLIYITDIFRALSLSRIVGAEVGFSSSSFTVHLWLESVNTLLEDATLLMLVAIVCFN